ncbi:cytochrome c biogenesis protein [Inhella inkyongensis]|uniref:Cytochrome c biogenesis protein n=1 Tax=Inhella inkyongensis TaxID=392593 RepID=A0A840S0E1_9BURK|nr:cytochrome c biogenesis protein ResB [Inhella inkyongensis]MBB5203253.1 cytochrome c biogenesis protein [Inhella inkyongensis]
MSNAPAPLRRTLLELLASMRFAIALLTLICIASVIGTVLKQREPLNNYINEFGPFWAELFGRLDLFTVYSAPWFLLILAFLVISTSLCIARQTPKILRDWQDAKLRVRAESLAAYHHHARAQWSQDATSTRQVLAARLGAEGWQFKEDERRIDDQSVGRLMASRKGRIHKLGYLAAHGAIVLVCLGGLLDGDLIVRLALQLQGKTLFTGSGNVTNPETHRLDTRNPSFRGNLFVPEGQRADTAVLTLPGGIALQQLPFSLELNKFQVEYYDTGMPKLFASEVVLVDGTERRSARIEVNKPLIHKGLAIYQSSFEDGGSKVTLKAEPLGPGRSLTIDGQVGGKLELPSSQQTLEVEALRVINVEDFGQVRGAAEAAESASGPKQSPFATGSAAKDPAKKTLRNIGPSITYRLRDAAGQAKEFHNYMQPVELDGQRVYLLGLRESASDEFRYLRAPADENDSLQGWLRLRRALLDPAQRQAAALAYAQTASDKPELREQIAASAAKALALLAGADSTAPGTGGLQALAQHIEKSVPEAERERVSGVLLRVLSGSLALLDEQARRAAEVTVPAADATRQAFLTQALMAISDSVLYPAPQIFLLEGFEQRQASVFQVTRAPGQKLVYLGAVLLMLGVFAMLYLRERRLWLWLEPAEGGTAVLLAYSSQRQGSDTDAEFERLKGLIAP